MDKIFRTGQDRTGQDSGKSAFWCCKKIYINFGTKSHTVCGEARRLRTSNKRRFKRRLKAFQKKYRSGEIDLEDIKRSLSSYAGHLRHGHTYKLKTRIYQKFLLTKAPKEKKNITDVSLK